jgi:hypothetical protein
MSDLFATATEEPRSIFDKDRHRWTADNYRQALSQLPDKLLNFSFLMITRRMIVSPAYLSLSPRAAKLLIACVNATWISETYRDRRNVCKHVPNKPDRIKTEPFMLPYSLCEVFSVGSRNQIKKAFDELKAFGFIAQVGRSWYNKPNIYRHIEDYLNLTWADIPNIKAQLKSKNTSIK